MNVIIEGTITFHKKESKLISVCVESSTENIDKYTKDFNKKPYIWIKYSENSVIVTPNDELQTKLTGRFQVVVVKSKSYLKKCILDFAEDEIDLTVVEELI